HVSIGGRPEVGHLIRHRGVPYKQQIPKNQITTSKVTNLLEEPIPGSSLLVLGFGIWFFLALSGQRIHSERAPDRQAKSESAAFTRLTLGEDVATVLAEDFAADRQAEAGSFGSLRADKRLENIGELVGWNAHAIVQNMNTHPALF